jgi:GntR family transcriptional regulator / MocR family aminotransferase
LDCERVFYIGTFSKSLFPSLRKGFVVAPDWAREVMIDIKRSTDSHTDVVLQATLATFIGEGHLARHIRRMRPIYAQRRRAFEQGARDHWKNIMEIMPGNAGLALGTRIILEKSDRSMSDAIIECARKHLPGALSLSALTLGAKGPQGLSIGYGGVEVDQIANSVLSLGVAMNALRRRLGDHA